MRAFLPLIIFAALLIGLAISLTRDPSKLPSEMIDRPFPEFTLPSLYEGEPDITEDIFKDKISVLNVFGSWCVSCTVEHPKLMEIGREKSAAIGSVQLIGMDWRDTVSAGQRWLETHGNPYDAVIFDGDSLLAIDLGVTGAPESFLIGPKGRIAYKHSGVLTDEVWESDVLPRITALRANMESAP